MDASPDKDPETETVKQTKLKKKRFKKATVLRNEDRNQSRKSFPKINKQEKTTPQ